MFKVMIVLITVHVLFYVCFVCASMNMSSQEDNSRMAENYVKLATSAYRQAARIPLLSSARIETPINPQDSLLQVSSVWSQNDLATYKEAKFVKSAIIDKASLVGKISSSPVAIDAVQLSTHEKYLRAVVKPGKEDSEQIIQIWERDFLKTSYNLKDIDAHGKIYCDQEFGGLEISEDLSKLVYVAERKPNKSLPFLHQGEVPEKATQGNQYDYKQDWGEQLVDKVDPVVAVLDLTTDQPAKIQIFDKVPSDVSPGKVRFWKNGIVGVAYKNTPRKLGKVYCSNRDTVLFYLDLSEEGHYTEIRKGADVGDEIGITRLTANGENGRLAWFERRLFKNDQVKIYPGPHEGEVYIMVLDDLGGEPYIIDTSASSVPTWGGIFVPSLSARCWLDADRFLISCPMQQTRVPVLVNCKDRKIQVLHEGNENVHILDVDDDIVLGAKSDPITPPHLVIARASEGFTFRPVFESNSVETFVWSPITLKHEDSGQEEGTNFEFKAYHIGNNETDRPLIVWPHGGPHSILTEEFSRTALYFCMAGFNILFVNYRGSIGFSDEFTRVLMGRVGDMDVKDCVLATEKCLELFPNLSKDKVFLMGGSHGGFLVTHLAGQYPDMFKGVVARNPVINIASMSEVTDIPDWTFNEAGAQYAFSNPQPALYQEMWAKSPVAHCQNIKAPILLMIGKNDLRVPPSQGYQFYHTLKAGGKEVYMHEYADNHPLGKPEHDANVMISAAVFFNQQIGKK